MLMVMSANSMKRNRFTNEFHVSSLKSGLIYMKSILLNWFETIQEQHSNAFFSSAKSKSFIPRKKESTELRVSSTYFPLKSPRVGNRLSQEQSKWIGGTFECRSQSMPWLQKKKKKKTLPRLHSMYSKLRIVKLSGGVLQSDCLFPGFSIPPPPPPPPSPKFIPSYRVVSEKISHWIITLHSHIKGHWLYTLDLRIRIKWKWV